LAYADWKGFKLKARNISMRLLYKPIERTGLSANQITVLNFLTNNLLAVFCFSRGNYIFNLIGLFFCIFGGMVDYIDGALARARGGETDLGKWLDTSLDWLAYLLLIGGISYGVDNMLCGIVCLIGTGYSNYIDTTRPSIRLDNLPFSPIFFIVLGAVLNQMRLCLYLMTFFSVLRASILFVLATEEK
jgi:phosphatidylglycerophosphate synthase